MTLKSQKRIVAKMLGIGANRVWIDPENLNRVEEAITRQDLRNLIESGVVKKRRIIGTSRVRANKIRLQKIRKRKRGHGSRSGKSGARQNKKELWMKKIRSLRLLLREMKNEKKIVNDEYWKLYKMSSGGFFRNRKHLQIYLEKMREESK